MPPYRFNLKEIKLLINICIMKKYLSLLIPIILLNCTQRADEQRANRSNSVSENNDSASAYLIADTIIYDVIIKNTNPYDKWGEKSLGKLQRGRFIDSLFALVYEKKAKAYDYFSNEELSPRQVREMEKEEGFSREDIGKIQFTEAWYFNKKLKTMNKKVISVALGHELYADSGELRGYKPVFKIDLNP